MLPSSTVENYLKRAVSKVLVPAIQVLLLCLLPLTAQAQGAAAAPAARSAPFAILDNSFLVEEAFNQEAGIFQNIFGFQRSGLGWNLTFTQEWPVRSQAHQFSYTVPFAGVPGEQGLGDVSINYRYQATMEGARMPAFSPRVSVIVPTGSSGFSTNSPGLQVNLPISKRYGDWYFHANAGLTWFPGAEVEPPTPGATRVSLVTPQAAASAIYRVQHMLNLMVESVLVSDQSVDAQGGRTRQQVFVFSPGIRGGWNIGDQQLILGVATPITWIGSDSSTGVFLYLSYELPFRK